MHHWAADIFIGSMVFAFGGAGIEVVDDQSVAFAPSERVGQDSMGYTVEASSRSS